MADTKAGISKTNEAGDSKTSGSGGATPMAVKVPRTDSSIVYNFLSESEAASAVEQLEKEIEWHAMTIGGKELARKGEFQGTHAAALGSSEDAVAWLRCPSTEAQPIRPFTPFIESIRQLIYKRYGHLTNIVKIQRYDNEMISIAPHADKTIDLADGVPIYNLRFGATRDFLLARKKQERVNNDTKAKDGKEGVANEIHNPMPHNTLFILGEETNQYYTHAIPTQSAQKCGASYSLIFRSTVTYKHVESGYMFGPRCQYPSVAALQDAIKTGKLAPKSDAVIAPSALVKLYGIENSRAIVPNQLYADFCKTST